MSVQTAIQYRWSDSAESVEMDGQWVILHAEQQTMTKLNELGGWIWENLKDGAVVGDLIAQVVDTFEVTADVAQQDVLSFLESLREIGVIEEVVKIHSPHGGPVSERR